jgi:predicted DNA-binding transcriptional regulator YafY
LTIDEIAKEMEVSRRTVQRMRAALDLVFPIEALQDGPQLRYRLQGHLPPGFLAINVTELADLNLAAETLRKQGQPERAGRLDDLRHRLLAAMRAQDRTRVSPDLDALSTAQLPLAVPGPRLKITQEVQDACQQALLSGTRLKFSYKSGHGLRDHEVSPRGLMIGAKSSLVAHGNAPGDPMLFRMDRISEARSTNTAAWPSEDFDLDTFAAQSFGVFQEAPEGIILRFDAEVSYVVEAFSFHPKQTALALPDGRVEVRFHSGGLLELARHLFTWGGAVEIVQPASLVKIMKEQVDVVASRLPS